MTTFHKPFNPRELVARIRAVLRRVSPAATSAEKISQHFGSLTLDTAGFRAFLDTKELPLSTLEFELLVELAGATGRVLSRESAVLERACAIVTSTCSIAASTCTCPTFAKSSATIRNRRAGSRPCAASAICSSRNGRDA